MAFQPHVKRALSQDSDFPHTFSWPSSSEMTTGRQSYFQSVSSDIIQFDNLEIVPSITSSIVAALDPTTLEVDFDHSCLEGLDKQLLDFPIDAYAATCWAEAVNEPEGPAHDFILGRSLAKDRENSDETSDSLSNESDSDTDECRTFKGYGLPLPIEKSSLAAIPHISYPSPISTKNHLFTSFEPSKTFALEPQITHYDPAHSIGLFPMPRRKVKATGVAALRAYLPLRRKKSSII